MVFSAFLGAGPFHRSCIKSNPTITATMLGHSQLAWTLLLSAIGPEQRFVQLT